MFSLRKWLYKPKRTDSTLLAQFYYADEALCDIATELDSFDGRREPERCARLVGQLRHCQDSVLQYIQRIMDEAIPSQRASRDFRVKYPDDLIQEGLSGQLWFGAECLAAGSSILNREVESASMRPLARSLTKQLDSLRAALRDMCLSRTGAVVSGQAQAYSDKIKEGLVAFDRLFADFELSYVSAMVPVKTMKEFEMSQDVAVMFSEAVDRALKRGLIVQDALDNCDPALMFTIPRLAIVTGLVTTADGPLNPDVPSSNMSEMFRPFQTLLKKIRDLLRSLADDELYALERILCNFEDSRAHALAAGEAASAGGKAERQAVHRRRRALTAASTTSSNGSSHDTGSGAVACIRCRCMAADGSKSVGKEQQPLQPSHKIDPAAAATAAAAVATSVAPNAAAVSDDIESHANASKITSPKEPSSVSGTGSENPVAEEVERDAEEGSGWAGKPPPERRNVSIQTDGNCRGGIGNGSSDRQCCKRNRSRAVAAATAATPTAVSTAAPSLVSSVDSSAASGTVAPPPSAVAGQYAFWLPDRTDSRRITVERSISYEGGGANAAAAARARLASDDTSSASDLPANSDSAATAACSAECSVCGDTLSSSESSLCSMVDGDSAAGGGGGDEDDGGSSYGRPCEDDEAAAACGDQASSDNCGSSVGGDDGADGEACRRTAASRDASSVTATRATDGRIVAGTRSGTSADLVHKLFVCISGVADQLQTNFASDLRGILKYVFDIHTSALSDDEDEIVAASCNDSAVALCPPAGPARHSGSTNGVAVTSARARGSSGNAQSPPPWVPDELNPQCSACKIPFTFVRRRHHCRNCGQIFCHRCSSNWAPLPNYGYDKPVRVCTKCFIYHVDPFAMDPSVPATASGVGSGAALPSRPQPT